MLWLNRGTGRFPKWIMCQKMTGYQNDLSVQISEVELLGRFPIGRAVFQWIFGNCKNETSSSNNNNGIVCYWSYANPALWQCCLYALVKTFLSPYGSTRGNSPPLSVVSALQSVGCQSPGNSSGCQRFRQNELPGRRSSKLKETIAIFIHQLF